MPNNPSRFYRHLPQKEEIGFRPKKIEDILHCINAARVARIKSLLIGAPPEAVMQVNLSFMFSC